MSKILIVDDEENIREVLSGILEDEGYCVEKAKNGIEGLKAALSGIFDLVILDVWLPGMGGIEVLEKIKEEMPDLGVIIVSGHGNIDMAVKAVKMGAFDFLEKPLSLDKIITVVKNGLTVEKLKKENRELKDSIFTEDKMTGSGDAMDKIRKTIKQVALSDVSVMILGENGTGKELVAREIHKKGNRKDFPFIEVNCASIPDSLIESELFGHEKGAFTGAISGRKGKFELAHQGTLFLDEVADMSLSAQAKVLRAVQEMRFERVGSEKQVTVNVRIICATNKDLQAEVKAERFREDLFFRLNVIPIVVPSLRERKEDILPLIKYFFEKYSIGGTDIPVSKIPCEENESFTIAGKTVSPEGLQILENYSWPGNIRELKNFIQRISVMTDEDEISAETVKYYLETGIGESKEKNESFAANDSFIVSEDENISFNDAKELFEKNFLLKKLEKNSYNIAKTAGELGVYPSNLSQKLKKLGISAK